jgi:hypothetical protein
VGVRQKVEPAEVLRYAGAHNLPLSEANRKLLETMIAEGNGGG